MDNGKKYLNFNVSMYTTPPDGTEDLMRLVNMALERLKLYSVLENKGPVSAEELKAYMEGSPLIFLIQNEPVPEIQEARSIDYRSHWILRFAYCNIPEIYIKYELEWFKLRFNAMTEQNQLKFLQENKFFLARVRKSEKRLLNLGAEIVYKIKFSEVPALVKMRKYPLHGGYVYTSLRGVVYWLLYKLEHQLKECLLFMKKARLTLIQDEQLQTVLSYLDIVKPPYMYKRSGLVALSEIDEEAEHFPLCMRIQHDTLRKTHHLKYFSRVQYTLFLKGIGLSLTDCLAFWESEFLKTMPEKIFRKKYAYRLKHLYGAVGGKIDYEPFSCQKIAEQAVTANQIHGCPYKHWDEKHLVEKLKQYSIKDADFDTILKLKDEKKYTEACTKCFESVNSCKPEAPISHPNQYYTSYCKLRDDIIDIEDIFVSDGE